MISYEQAQALLARYGVPDTVVRHSIGVAQVAHDLARRIHERHPELPVDPDRVRIAALLHDIGRCGEEGPHQERGCDILREEGLDEIAGIVLPHGALYEWTLLAGEPNDDFLPTTLEQKIVAYADIRFCQEPMTVSERVADAIARKPHLPDVERILRLAEERLLGTERELEDLAG